MERNSSRRSSVELESCPSIVPLLKAERGSEGKGGGERKTSVYPFTRGGRGERGVMILRLSFFRLGRTATRRWCSSPSSVRLNVGTELVKGKKGDEVVDVNSETVEVDEVVVKDVKGDVTESNQPVSLLHANKNHPNYDLAMEHIENILPKPISPLKLRNPHAKAGPEVNGCGYEPTR